jgi:hypothetical protein
MTFVPAIDTPLQLNPLRFYQDNPSALGSGTYAESYAVPHGGGLLKLASLACRVDFPFGAGEQAIIRLYRYRKVPGPFGAFSYTQITDTFVFNNTFDWSWTYPINGNIRNGFSLDPVTDSIAVSNVYTAGGSPSARALRVDFTYEKAPPP